MLLLLMMMVFKIFQLQHRDWSVYMYRDVIATLEDVLFSSLLESKGTSQTANEDSTVICDWVKRGKANPAKGTDIFVQR